jgi:hypothetical protein
VWINVTQEWFDEFYNGGFEPLSDDGSNTTRRDRRLAGHGNYGVVPGSMSCTIELLESHFINNDDNETTATLILLYNQQLDYRAFNNSDKTSTLMGPLQYTTLPFRSRTARPVYVQRLASNELMSPLWQSLTVDTLPVPQILGPKRKPTDTSANSATATDKAEKDSDTWSIGAIAGVVVAGLVAIMVGAAAVLYFSQRDDGRHDNVASLVPDFERATFSFGGGSTAASGGGGGVCSGRMAAADDAGGATDLEASSDEKPRYVFACIRYQRH